MPRKYCSNCEYPISTCLCDCVEKIDCPIQIDILQHPSEQHAAKNTARLVKLCMPSCKIWVGETADDFAELYHQLQHAEGQCFVFFPNADSIDGAAVLPKLPVGNFSVSNVSESNAPVSNTPVSNTTRWIFIDGTWKKAFKIWQLNPWLQELTSLHFENVQGQYEIRKAPKADQLSTLECVVKSLRLYSEKIDVSPLIACFDALKSHFKPS